MVHASHETAGTGARLPVVASCLISGLIQSRKGVRQFWAVNWSLDGKLES